MQIPKRVYCLTLFGKPLVRRFILKAPQLWPAGASPITNQQAGRQAMAGVGRCGRRGACQTD